MFYNLLASALPAIFLYSQVASASNIYSCASNSAPGGATYTSNCFTCQALSSYSTGWLPWQWDYVNRGCFAGGGSGGYRCIYWGNDYTVPYKYWTHRNNAQSGSYTVKDPKLGDCYYDANGALQKDSWSACPSTAPKNEQCVERHKQIKDDEDTAKNYYRCAGSGCSFETSSCQRCPIISQDADYVNANVSESGDKLSCTYPLRYGHGGNVVCTYSSTGGLSSSQGWGGLGNLCPKTAKQGTLLCEERKAAEAAAEAQAQARAKRALLLYCLKCKTVGFNPGAGEDQNDRWQRAGCTDEEWKRVDCDNRLGELPKGYEKILEKLPPSYLQKLFGNRYY